MPLIDSRKILSVFSLCLLLLNLSPAAAAAANRDWPGSSTLMSQQSDGLMLAGSENYDADDEQPRSGALILPAAVADDDDENDEKKCMTICQRWGQECMIDTTRGVRKCRRTCKEYGQACF